MPNTDYTIEQKNTQIFQSHTNQEERTLRGVPGEMYGLEMEVYSSDGRWAVAAVANEGETEDFVDLEDDGSLSESNGIELVSRGPKPVSKLLEDNGWLDRLMNRITQRGGVRFGPQRDGYGLHINVNCAGWSWEEKNAFCAAIVLNPAINQEIATRSENGSGVYNVPLHVYGHTRDYDILTRGSAPSGTALRPFGYTSRDFNTYIRVSYNNTDCIECRIFRMNTDPSVIKGYIKHLQEVRKFSKKYKNVLLYLAAASSTFSSSYPVLGTRSEFSYGDWTKVNNYLKDLWNNRATVTAAQAAATIPLEPNEANASRFGEHYIAVFDSSKTFRQRTLALRDAWYSPEPSFVQSLSGGDPWRHGYGGIIHEDEDEFWSSDDSDDDDYCCEDCNGPRSEAA